MRNMFMIAGLAASCAALAACQNQAGASGSVSVSASAAASAPASTHSAAAVVAAENAPACRTTDLRISFGRPAATGTARQYRVRVAMLNRGDSTCSMYGYPGMDLVGDGGDIRVHVPREAEGHATISLSPGKSASFTLTYLLETDQQVQGELGAWGPNTVVITSPGSTQQQTLGWELGPVDRYSVSAGRGTYLSPVGR
jgi:hypothetical protein